MSETELHSAGGERSNANKASSVKVQKMSKEEQRWREMNYDACIDGVG